MLVHQLIPSKLCFILLSCLLMLITSSTQATAQHSEKISVVQAAAPLYPQELISPTPIMGDVRVNVQIDVGGTVVLARAIGGHPRLIKVSEAAARRWLFSGADAKDGMRTIQLTFTFRFVDNKKPEELGPIFKPPFAVEVRAAQPVIILERAGIRAKQQRKEP